MSHVSQPAEGRSVSKQTEFDLYAPDAAGDEARDGLTVFMITLDGLAAIQPISLHLPS